MQRERGMFRVYVCPRCGSVAYASVESEAESSPCKKCKHLIVDTPGMIYTVTVQEAEASVRELVQIKEVTQKSRRVTRGRGLKRRIEAIIVTLVELNRGRPVLFSEVLQECVDAGIDPEKALRFITMLESEGLISNDGIVIELKEDYSS